MSGIIGGAGSKSGIVGQDEMNMTDQWVIRATDGGGDLDHDWVRPSAYNFGTGWASKGTGLTEASGIFTFPKTGLYVIHMTVIVLEDSGGGDNNMGMTLKMTTNNGSNYYSTLIARSHAIDVTGQSYFNSASNMGFINATSITGGTTVKFYFEIDSISSGNFIHGDTSTLNTGFSIMRISNAQ